MKHTEGPWKVMCGSVYTEWGRNYPIAHMDRSPENGTVPMERDKNARLIAASPDLLEACRLARDWIDRTLDDFDLESDGTLEEVKQAISKAEGREVV